MSKTIKYIGTVRPWPELATTGRQSIWFPGQAEQRSDSEAAQLLATCLFSDVDATQLTEQKVAKISGVVSNAGIVDFGLLPEPWCIAHRGAGGLIAPQGCIEAYEIGASYGGSFVVDGGDWRASKDGAIFDCHDTTVDATTSLLGNVSSFTAQALRRAPVDCSAWFGWGYADRVGLLEPQDIFPMLRGRTCCAPEPKDATSAVILSAYLASLGMQKQCLINAFDINFLTPFAALGFPYLARNIQAGAETTSLANAVTGAATCAALLAAGVKYVTIDASDANGVAAIAVAAAAGMKVAIYTTGTAGQMDAGLWRQWQRLVQYAGLPVVGYVSEDPLYFMGATAKYRYSTDTFAISGGAPMPGQQDRNHTLAPHATSKRGANINGGFEFWNIDTNNSFALYGPVIPIANLYHTLTVTLTIVSLPTDHTRWFGFVCGCPNDDDFKDAGATNSNGNIIQIKPSNTAGGGSAGQLTIVAETNGTQVANATQVLSAELVVGDSITVTVVFDATNITATVTPVVGTASGTKTLVNGAQRGGYAWAAVSAITAGTLRVRHSNIIVT